RNISESAKPQMKWASGDAPMEACVICGGKVCCGCGSDLVACSVKLEIIVVVPTAGSKRMKSLVVTISALLSMPKAPPSGGFASANVCLAFDERRSMSVTLLDGEAGAVL